MNKLYVVMSIPLLMVSRVRAEVHVHNDCAKSIYAKVHFIGAGSPGKYVVAPGKDQKKVLLGIKKGYDVWVNTGAESDVWDSKGKLTDKAKNLKSGIWKKIISHHGTSDTGVNVHVHVYEHPDPKYNKETLYGFEH